MKSNRVNFIIILVDKNEEKPMLKKMKDARKGWLKEKKEKQKKKEKEK